MACGVAYDIDFVERTMKREFVFSRHQSIFSGRRPRIDYFHWQPADVNQVSGSDFGAATARDAGDQDIADIAIVACRQSQLFQFTGLQSGEILSTSPIQARSG